MGRQFNMRLSDEDHEKLRNLAGQSGLNPSELVRHWIRGAQLDAKLAIDIAKLNGAIERRRRKLLKTDGDR